MGFEVQAGLPFWSGIGPEAAWTIRSQDKELTVKVSQSMVWSVFRLGLLVCRLELTNNNRG